MAEKTNFDGNTIKKEFNEAYKQAHQHWTPFLREAKRDLKMVMGDPWSVKDKRRLRKQDRDPLVFNKAQRICRLVEGYQRKHRLALKVEPIEGTDDNTANQLTGILMWVMQYANAYNVLSDAFAGGSLKTGMNLVNIYMDYTDDPVNGDIKFKRIPYNAFLIDPFSTERDLSDCTFLLRREYFSKKTLKALIPNRADLIDKLRVQGRDDKFEYFTPPVDLLGGQFLRYSEFWVRQYQPIKTIVDPKTGAWGHTTKGEKFVKRLLTAYPNLKVLDGYKRTSELRILVEDEVVYVGDDPGGLDDYPYVPIFGFWVPEHHEAKFRLQGLARCIRDPQDETNKRRVKMLDILDSQITSGFKAEENAVIDPASLYQTGQSRVIFTGVGKLDKVQQLQSTDIPAGLFRLQELMDKDITEIPGANDEMFGAPESHDIRQAGILSKLRQAAGLTVLQDLFDNYRLAKRLVGRKIVKLIQANFTPAKVKRIINEEPTQEFYDKKFGKYDCLPTEGVLSDSQRQMYYAELRSMQQDGAPIPWSAILDAAPLQYKSKLAQFMKQQDEEMSEQAKFQKQMEQLTAMLMQAKTMRDIESAREKTSQAVENRANAALDRIKAAKEVGKMDFEELMEILRFVFEVEQAGKDAQTLKKTKPIIRK